MKEITREFVRSLGFIEGHYIPQLNKSANWIQKDGTDSFLLNLPGEGYGRLLLIFFDEDPGCQVSYSSFGMASAPLFNSNVTEDRLVKLLEVLRG